MGTAKKKKKKTQDTWVGARKEKRNNRWEKGTPGEQSVKRVKK